MEFIKESISGVNDAHPCRTKHEDTEERRDPMEMIQASEGINEVEVKCQSRKNSQKGTPKTRAKSDFTSSRCEERFAENGRGSHSQVKPFNCDQCCRKFVLASHLKRHLKLHSNENPYLCPFCGKSFSWLYYLQEHQKTHGNMTIHVCVECGSTFTKSSDLYNHQRLHTQQNRYKCSYCGRTFNHSGNMKKHERVHTGEKPYHCSSCGKSFRCSSSLLKHKRKHCPKLFE
ncbi:zinc finger protein 572 [Triplophysa rosa]|uniref:zinc finger protein 572 n=1 Tax=Triplophysa rosa TaxID=992332 RepID=UPI00254606CE|nr:zinc finger protein 572 [Triplophysa rosa]